MKKRENINLNMSIQKIINIMAESDLVALHILKVMIKTNSYEGVLRIIDLYDMNIRGSQIVSACRDCKTVYGFYDRIYLRDAEMINYVNKEHPSLRALTGGYVTGRRI